MRSITSTIANVVFATLIAISLFLATFTATHAAAPVRIVAVTAGQVATGDVFFITFSNGTSCQQGQTALNSNDNPVVGLVSNWHETYFMIFYTGIGYTQHNYAMRCD